MRRSIRWLIARSKLGAALGGWTITITIMPIELSDEVIEETLEWWADAK